MIYIGLVGYAGSGKDTAYNLIRDNIEPGAARLAFADKLKDIADNMLEIADFDRVANDGNRQTKEEIRPLLVWLGEYARKQDKDYWIDRIVPDVSYLIHSRCPMVIFTDVRYPNEAEYILKQNGYLIYIESPAMPANTTEKETIKEIIRLYNSSPRFYLVENSKISKTEFVYRLAPVINKIQGDYNAEKS